MPDPDADIVITPAVRAYLAAFDAYLAKPTPYRAEAKHLALTDLHANKPRPLSPREAEILNLRAHGTQRHRIAQRLGLARRTVDHHMENVARKAGTSDPYLLAYYAIRNGYLT